MCSPLILDAGLSPLCVRHAPLRAHTGREHRHGAHARPVEALRRRLLVLEAQLAKYGLEPEDVRWMDAHPQHGHDRKVRQGRPTGDVRLRL